MSDQATVVYLAGDSYPRDLHVEENARRVLAPSFAAWCSQREVLAMAAEATFKNSLSHRVAVLGRALETLPDPASIILFGRSSGARVATLHAASHAVRAVVCLGYPFHPPGREGDPGRYAHLARLRVPTLIVQGRSDPYNGPDELASIPLSDCVAICFVDANHEFRGAADLWATIRARVEEFLGGGLAASSRLEPQSRPSAAPDGDQQTG